jgi:hypothetical protein
MGGQGGAWGADWDIPNTAALAGPTFSINNNSCNTIPKIKNVNYKLLLKVSVFLFSKSKILSIKRFKRSDSEIMLCRNCFLTSLECRRHHHARFRLLHELR